MSYTPSYIINHQQLMNYHYSNSEIFDWGTYKHDEDALNIISRNFPFTDDPICSDIVNIRDFKGVIIHTDYSREREELESFLIKNNIEYYRFGS